MTEHSHEKGYVAETKGFAIHSWAKYYDAIGGFLTLWKAKKMQSKVLDLVAIKPGDIVLDVGSGTGNIAIMAKQRQGIEGTITGIDPSSNMVAIAQEKADKAGVAVDFRVGVIEKLDFDDNTFDVVLSTMMMHHLPDDLKQAGMAEVRRVLKPGGKFLIADIEPKVFSLASLLHGHLSSGEGPTVRSKYLEYMKTAGFDNLQSGETGVRAIVYITGE